MPKHGKKFAAALEKVDRDHMYSPREAVKLLKQYPDRKFDETVELNLRLGVDPRKADQMVRGALSLPKGTGKTMRVAVFAKGGKAKEAEEAGADFVGDEDLAARVGGGWVDFDAVVATPDMMPVLGKLGRVLGPRGLMPNPKSGTVTDDVAKAVNDIKGGRIEYRTDKNGNLHLIVGKKSFTEDDLIANYAAIIDEVYRAKPAAAKGRFVKTVTLSTTMGPGIKIDPQKSKDIIEEELEDAPA
ncbi:MAG: large subunit ribosomal protein [Actinomycetota bacterium]|jgi:large subunit ribosomal protein L1|nr:large subunit ribosomal protein [Actinomycetota bacterium]